MTQPHSQGCHSACVRCLCHRDRDQRTAGRQPSCSAKGPDEHSPSACQACTARAHTPQLTTGSFLLPLLPQHHAHHPQSLARGHHPSACWRICRNCDFWSTLNSIGLTDLMGFSFVTTEPPLQNYLSPLHSQVEPGRF